MAVRKINGNMNVISNNLKVFKLEKHLSQADLTRELNLIGINLHKNDIYLIESNKRTVKDYELWGFSKVLEKDLVDFFFDINKKIEF